MNKLVLMFAAIAAVSFASCGGSKSKAAAADSTAVDSSAVVQTVDSAATDSAATPADSVKA